MLYHYQLKQFVHNEQCLIYEDQLQFIHLVKQLHLLIFVKSFIEEDFEGGRHQKRIDMLEEK